MYLRVGVDLDRAVPRDLSSRPAVEERVGVPRWLVDHWPVRRDARAGVHSGIGVWA